MKVSARHGDTGFIKNRRGISVSLDGEPIFDCVVADEEKSEVIVRERGDDGQLIMDEYGVREITKFGHVYISIPSCATTRTRAPSA
jgi:hypothetical protein